MKKNQRPSEKSIAIKKIVFLSLEKALHYANPSVISLRYYQSTDQAGIRFPSQTRWINAAEKNLETVFYEVIDEVKKGEIRNEALNHEKVREVPRRIRIYRYLYPPIFMK